MARIEGYGWSHFIVSDPTKHVSGTSSSVPEMCPYISYINTYFKSKLLYKYIYIYEIVFF